MKMAVTRILARLSSDFLLKPRNQICSIERCASGAPPPWNYLWQPGEYPRTEEERLKAAEKYNLHPAEYEVYPEEAGHGDYPKLPLISAEAKDPYYPWDIPVYRKNYGEPMHKYSAIMFENGVPYGVKERIAPSVAISTLCGIVFVFFSIYFAFDPYPSFRPVMEKQYFKPGTVHYNFEPAK
ncbi:hypothetical protein KM043_015707 [Ampulex compressa]|nr:hypothetical protein KM043_015707 [Ampulex compressa]